MMLPHTEPVSSNKLPKNDQSVTYERCRSCSCSIKWTRLTGYVLFWTDEGKQSLNRFVTDRILTELLINKINL